MRDTEYLFRNLKITLGQVKECEGMTKGQAIKALKVGYRHFYTVIKSNKLGYLFHSKANRVYFIPHHLITFSMARECAGTTMVEAAKTCKVSP